MKNNWHTPLQEGLLTAVMQCNAAVTSSQINDLSQALSEMSTGLDTEESKKKKKFTKKRPERKLHTTTTRSEPLFGPVFFGLRSVRSWFGPFCQNFVDKFCDIHLLSCTPVVRGCTAGSSLIISFNVSLPSATFSPVAPAPQALIYFSFWSVRQSYRDHGATVCVASSQPILQPRFCRPVLAEGLPSSSGTHSTLLKHYRVFCCNCVVTHVQDGQKKWWKSWTPVNGEVTHHISPFRQRVVGPLLKNMPGNFVKKVVEHAPFVGPAVVFLFATVYWADGENERMHRSHRP